MLRWVWECLWVGTGDDGWRSRAIVKHVVRLGRWSLVCFGGRRPFGPPDPGRLAPGWRRRPPNGGSRYMTAEVNAPTPAPGPDDGSRPLHEQSEHPPSEKISIWWQLPNTKKPSVPLCPEKCSSVFILSRSFPYALNRSQIAKIMPPCLCKTSYDRWSLRSWEPT
jgi:hypothetical protein